jgi:hypothetical protein
MLTFWTVDLILFGAFPQAVLHGSTSRLKVFAQIIRQIPGRRIGPATQGDFFTSAG